MGTSGKLAVVEFEGRKILIAVSRGKIEKIAEGEAPRVIR
jgi:flagellar protein FliO/FliZ